MVHILQTTFSVTLSYFVFQIVLKYAYKSPVDYKSTVDYKFTLIQEIACHYTDDKPFREVMLQRLMAPLCHSDLCFSFFVSDIRIQ